MKNAILIAGVTVFLFSCAKPEKKEVVSQSTTEDYFAGTKGCFLLYNMKTGVFEKVIGEDNCKQPLPACSTFKVPLAAMAFDAGILKNENVVLKWDGKKDIREESNHDHNAKTWMRDSIVWFSQRLTPQLGKAKLQKYLNDFDYGNKDLSAGIKQAWLVSPSSKTGALKITGYQQIDFLKKLWSDQLPVSKRAMALTRDITYLETSPNGFRLNGKTGSNFFDKERKTHLGWFISHIEGNDKEYLAVTNFADLAPVEIPGYGGPRAKTITKKILADEKLW